MSNEESVDLTPGVVWTEAQLAVVRDLTARAFRAEQAVERVREFVDGFAARHDGHPTATDELWILSLHRVLNGPQSPPSHAGRAEGDGRMYSGGQSVELSSQDETDER